MGFWSDSDTDEEAEKARQQEASECVKFIDRVMDCSDSRKSCTVISVGFTGFAIGLTLLSLYQALEIYSLAAILLTAIVTIIFGMVCFCACNQAGENEASKSRRKRRLKKALSSAIPPPYAIKIRDEPPAYSEVVVPTYSEVAADGNDKFKKVNREGSAVQVA